jgi:hypothetical protein
MNSLLAAHADGRVRFAAVYIREAHAADEVREKEEQERRRREGEGEERRKKRRR